MRSDRPIQATSRNELVWRSRRSCLGIALILAMMLSLIGVMAVMVTHESASGAVLRRLVPLQVARGGSSYRSVGVSYAVFDDGALSRIDPASGAFEAAADATTVVHVLTTGKRTRHGLWAVTQEKLHFLVDVMSVTPERTDISDVDAIVDAAMPALVEDFLRNVPDWWFEKEPAVVQHHRIVSRIRWLGVAQNIATLAIFLLLPVTFTRWMRVRKIHKRLHALVAKKQCPKCGYCLIGQPHNRCSECGEVL